MAVEGVPGAAFETARGRELGIAGRLVVGILVAAGIVVATRGDFSLFWFIPYGGIGALLVIRRPRTSIGWLLLALGWAFVGVSVPVPATAEDLAAGAAGPLVSTLAVLSVLAGPLIFYLFAVLASVFPSGSLPGGRWGIAARMGLAVGLVTVIVGALVPTINVAVWSSPSQVAIRNPAALLPDLPIWQVVTADTAILPVVVLMVAAAISLFVRFRRSAGIERQQLSWITAAIAFVVVTVVGGFIVGQVAPALADSGVIWLGAIVAFPCVPIAVGIAVMRYRLYEIDTIINRAIVYGLLTAVLAGASAAVIGVTKQLFEGVLGPGSELSVIVSTLVVVSAFEPIKKTISSVVDRRFQEVHDPSATLSDFVTDVRSALSSPDPERTLRRFAETAVNAYGAAGGTLRWRADDGPGDVIGVDGTAGAPSRRKGKPTSDLAATATAGPLAARIDLDDVHASSDVGGLRSALAAVLGELADPRRAGIAGAEAAPARSSRADLPETGTGADGRGRPEPAQDGSIDLADPAA
jgi:hypothetical protein